VREPAPAEHGSCGCATAAGVRPAQAGPAAGRARPAPGHRCGAGGLPIGRSWAADFRV